MDNSVKYNYTYADLMLTIGGKLLMIVVVIMLLFFGNDYGMFQNGDSVREFVNQSKNPMSSSPVGSISVPKSK